MSIAPDRKDWTWVLERACPECGSDARLVDRTELPRLIREAAEAIGQRLADSDATRRPSDQVWSTLEYGCHVRDVCRIFDDRLALLLAEEDPQFANWDQDRSAAEGRYADQDARVVTVELTDAAEQVAGRFADVDDEQWARPGRRSNGSIFTVESLGRYLVHDLVHHVHDVAGGRR